MSRRPSRPSRARPSSFKLAAVTLALVARASAQTCPAGQTYYPENTLPPGVQIALSSGQPPAHQCCPDFPTQTPQQNVYCKFELVSGQLRQRCDFLLPAPAVGYQTYQVGHGATEMEVNMWSGRGKGTASYPGGIGAELFGSTNTRPGQYQIYLNIQGGADGAAGGAAAGGGYTSILYENQELITAGGGGGAGTKGPGQNAGFSSYGWTTGRAGDALTSTEGGGGAGFLGGRSAPAGSGLGGGGGQHRVAPEVGGRIYSTNNNNRDPSVRLVINCQVIVVPTTTVTKDIPGPTSYNVESQTETVTLSPTSTVTHVKTVEAPTPSAVTSTVTETPAVSTVQSTSTTTQTLSDSTETSTTFPATRTVKSTVTVSQGVVTSTRSAQVTSTTGSSTCVQYRMVYPASCCPASYVAMTGRARQRRGEFGRRALSTLTLTGSTSTIKTTTIVTSTTQLADPTESVTTTHTADPETVLSTTTAKTPLETKHVVETSTQDGKTSTRTVEGATPTKVDETTITVPSSTKFTTTTSTAYSQASCALTLGGTQVSCPLPLLAGTDHVLQVTLLNTKKLLSGRSVIVDCGSAGTFYY